MTPSPEVPPLGNDSHPGGAPVAFCSIDESYKYIFLPICYSFTFVFSLSLNAVVLYRSFRRTKRWNASLIYMVNLASTDFMYGLSLPFLVASYVMRDRWVFGDFMCRLVRFLFYFNLYGSIFFLTCISVHRYLGICHPMRVIALETKKAVKCACVLVWAVVFALTCPIFRFARTARAVNGGAYNCWDDAIDREFSDYVPYGVVLHLLGFFVPFSVIAWCYSHVVRTIFKTLPSHRRREEAAVFPGADSPYAGRRRKSIRTIVTITLLFALCFFPFHVTRTVFLLLKLSKGVPCQTVTTVSMCYKITRPLASFNAWLNALLYFLTKDKGGCCPPPAATAAAGPLLPLRMMEKGEDHVHRHGKSPLLT
ncbi:P2Y purinoceptor 3 [Corythoichthys intestinalis]|uniref:P2Y purinoceptor 3 n=1 Tax=Corythoichthys intestinalis TaxID=161448 RepID=UPI0025A5CC72|nr:P2Y purinoceptor 3 [Corythoichthys intestinalis]XP_061810933.1 P2Y purinoceptor 3-like [Nerophis lumbriciformis]